MTSPAHTVQEADALAPPLPAASRASAHAEAARYTLLRRLAPSMRHHLVVNLQPIGMIYEVMDRRLRAAEPKLAEVHESAQKINGFARAALQSSLDMVTWLAPEEGATITESVGLKDCMSLLSTSFTFGGYPIRNQVAQVEGQVGKAAMRNVLAGALMHLTDEHPAPAEIELLAQAGDHGLVLTIRLRATAGEQGFSTAPAYRPLTRADFQALADAEGAQVLRDGEHALCITVPWASPAVA
jgi:hypothetical protein